MHYGIKEVKEKESQIPNYRALLQILNCDTLLET